MNSCSTPPPLRLNAHCSICEFKEACYAEAKQKDDLSLLRGLKEKDITALHNKGIFTLTQFSYTFRPRKARKGISPHAHKHNHALQSRAIRDNSLYIVEKPVLPSAKTSIYLDVEGLPDKDSYYLIGLLISNGTSQSFHSFWADNKEQERSTWHRFLEAINKVNGDFTILHYGRYDVQFLKQMRGRYGGNDDLLNTIEASAFNVLSAIHSHLYFPVLSNDLKSIASSIGFKWSMADASGLESIVWHQQWANGGDPAIKQKLIQYNKEDCLALEAVVSVLRAVCDDAVTSYPIGLSQVVSASNIKPEGAYRFQKQTFFFPELAHINKCAYFDYQRDKVYLRTKKHGKKSRTRQNSRKRTKCRVNKVIEYPKPMKCSRCGSDTLRSRRRYQKDILDLRFFKGGVKAWNERHIARSYKCQSCGQVFYPEEYLAIGGVHRKGRRTRFGPGLHNWCVYNKVALGQSLGQIVGGLDNIFGLCFDRSIGERAMERASVQYRDTYLAICERLRTGQLVHADETWVSITGRHGGKGYIWAFANMENAVYKFSLTRDGTTPKAMLGTFTGVLVSDFYAAYDSLTCLQQKCLIHLIRDMNKDVFKYPFDEEYKRIVHSFGVLLRAIVETIDQYGLTRRHLHKHQDDVNNFYREVIGVEYRSEIARRYQKRFASWRDNLFVFLDRDGIPWNNNNGENAVKTFVLRRKLIGAFAEDRIEGYLILLSIFQTLRYRGISFLSFFNLARQTLIGSAQDGVFHVAELRMCGVTLAHRGGQGRQKAFNTLLEIVGLDRPAILLIWLILFPAACISLIAASCCRWLSIASPSWTRPTSFLCAGQRIAAVSFFHCRSPSCFASFGSPPSV